MNTGSSGWRFYLKQVISLFSVITLFSGGALAAAPVSGFYTGQYSDGQSETAVSRNADLLQKVNQMQTELQELRGIVEEQSHELTLLKQQINQTYVDLERRFTQNPLLNREIPVSNLTESGEQKVPSPSLPGKKSSMEPLLKEPSKNSNGEQKAYDAAYELLRARHYSEAMIAFQQFLAAYSSGKYIPNAHYWLGEIYLEQNRLDEAQAAFALVLSQFPTDKKIPDATLKLGFVYDQKGEKERAQEILNQVVINFPEHPAARLAENRLKQLK